MEIIAGKCEFMCPRRERLWREKHGLLHKYEVVQNSGSRKCQEQKADPEKAVKQYSRPAAGRNLLNCEELRPLPVLERTVHYLAISLMTRKDDKWIDIYEFCSDRLRSVYQDLTIQRISGRDASWILQSSVRFFLYSDYRLLDETCLQRYDAAINSHLLMEFLKQLLTSHLHPGREEEGEGGAGTSFLAEMASIYVLFNLDSTEALQFVLTLDRTLRCHPLLSAAIRIGVSHYLGEYLSVLRALHTLPVLLACCLHRHLLHLRRQVLLRLSHGFSSKACRFPLDLLSRWLQMSDPAETRELCTLHGLNIEGDSVVFLKSAFSCSSAEAPRRHDPVLEEKLLGLDVAKLISGGDAKLHHRTSYSRGVSVTREATQMERRHES